MDFIHLFVLIKGIIGSPNSFGWRNIGEVKDFLSWSITLCYQMLVFHFNMGIKQDHSWESQFAFITGIKLTCIMLG